MVVHAYNSSTQEAEEENHEFEARLGYRVRLCIKTTAAKTPVPIEPGTMVHSYNPNLGGRRITR
jgi:hypothetical protein